MPYLQNGLTFSEFLYGSPLLAVAIHAGALGARCQQSASATARDSVGWVFGFGLTLAFAWVGDFTHVVIPCNDSDEKLARDGQVVERRSLLNPSVWVDFGWSILNLIGLFFGTFSAKTPKRKRRKERGFHNYRHGGGGDDDGGGGGRRRRGPNIHTTKPPPAPCGGGG